MADAQAWAEGSELAENKHNRAVERKQQLTDEQRQAREKMLTDAYSRGAITPQQVQRGIDDLYQHEPQESRLHRLGRFFSRKPAPQLGPSPTADFQGIVAGAKTPEQLQQEEFDRTQKQGEAGQQAMLKAYRTLMEQAKSPEEKRLIDSIFGVKPETARNIAGAAGQPYQNAKGEWVRPVQGENGITEEPMPAGWQPPKKAAKPVFKVLKGHEVLIDPETKSVVKDFGPAGTARVTRRQVLQYDADGKPHMVTLTSVATPEGGQMDVDTEPGSEGAHPKGPAPKKGAASQPKPGQLDFRKSTPQSNKAKGAVDTAEAAYRDVEKASQDPTPVGDQGIVLAWLRGRVNRVTASEIAAVNNLGGVTMKLEGDIARIESGKMTLQQRQWFLKSAKDNYENAKAVAGKYDQPGPKSGAGDDAGDDEFLKKVKPQ